MDNHRSKTAKIRVFYIAHNTLPQPKSQFYGLAKNSCRMFLIVKFDFALH
jgi:hypothetical protein